MRAISSTLRDNRCHGLTDEQIRDNILAIRGEGVAWNHCLDWAAHHESMQKRDLLEINKMTRPSPIVKLVVETAAGILGAEPGWQGVGSA